MCNGAFGYDCRLPEGIRHVFMWLCQDVASLQSKWSFYLGLFSSQENTALLSRVARRSFQTIEESLRNDMTMAICRLSDPAGIKDKRNLSFKALAEQCGDAEGLREALDHFQDACAPVRKHRNKRVGHNDLDTIIKPRDHPLPGIGRGDVEKILRLAGDVLNTIYQRYVADGEFCFAPLEIGGAEDLMSWLRRAAEHGEDVARPFRGNVD